MRASLHTRTKPPPGEEFDCYRDYIFFAAHIDLSKLFTPHITFKLILLQLYYELRYNPPKALRGGIWNFTVKSICYWAKVGNQSTFKTIKVPLKDPTAVYPPLTKDDKFFRVHFIIESERVKDFNIKKEYPKKPHARSYYVI